MDYDPSHAAPSHPAVGLVVAAVGFSGYFWTTAYRMFFGAAEIAQAAVPSSPMTPENVAQWVTAGIAMAGGIMAFVAQQRQKAHDARVAQKKAEDDAEIARKKADADAERDIWWKDEMARLRLEQVKQHAATREHLSRQDAALESVKQAVATPPAAPPPVVVIARPPAATAATPPAEPQS